MQFFGTLSPSASDMYTCRGRMSHEVSKNAKLALGAAARGKPHVPQLPTIDPKHKGRPNVLSELIVSVLDDPSVSLAATCVVATPVPDHLAKATAGSAAARS
eukprot:15535356-Heterocapsa_arctica.AAC.1